MLFVTCFWLLASFDCDKRAQEANSEKQEENNNRNIRPPIRSE